jgi:hypothetical protein
MDGWMGGWTGGWVDGWVDGWMDGWIDGWLEGWMIHSHITVRMHVISVMLILMPESIYSTHYNQ